MDKTPIKRDAFDFLPWAGLCIDPGLDPELFARLPGWRQRERLFIRKKVEAYERFTLADVLRAGIGEQKAASGVSLPATMSLGSLRRASRIPAPAPGLQVTLEGEVTHAALFAQCTIDGEGRRLLNTQPAHGLYAYVWASALVRRGQLASLPFPYLLELEEGVAAITGKQTNLRTPEAKGILQWLDLRTEYLVSCVA